MRALLVGAGAVGAVYGRHLQMGGATIGFLVKEKYQKEVSKGMDLFHLNKGRKSPSVRLEGAEVYTSIDKALEQPWEQIWICVSSTAILGEWFDELTQKMSRETTLVFLPPGAMAQEHVATRFPADRTVGGLITMISYQSPLPEDDRGEGIAYWFPPASPNPFWGDPERAKAVADALKKGGCPAKVNQKGMESAPFASAMLMPHLIALEGANWSFQEIRKGDWLKLASAACEESAAIVSEVVKLPKPAAGKLIKPLVMRLVTRVAPCVVPLPLEIYLKYHFTKVRDQTITSMRFFVEQGEGRGQSTRALRALLEAGGVDHSGWGA